MNNKSEKIIKDEFVDLEDIFKTFFKGVRGKRKKDLNKKLIAICNITKQQSKSGVQKNKKISVADICNCCKGTGKKIQYQVNECKICKDRGIVEEEKNLELGKVKIEKICNNCQCEMCYGTGFVYNEHDIAIKIPAKIKNNDYLLFKGRGNKFNIDDKRGDLYIKIHIYGSKSKRKGKIIYE